MNYDEHMTFAKQEMAKEAELIELVAREMAERAGFCWENCTQCQWRWDAIAAIAALRKAGAMK